MSVFHSVDAPHCLVLSDFRGRITLDEIAAACTKLRHNPEFRANFRQLADFSEVEMLDLRPEDLTAISTTYDPFSNRSKRAFVATDPATRKTVTAYQSISHNPEFHIYGSLFDATASLDLEFTILKTANIKCSTREQAPPGEQGAMTFGLPPIIDSTFKPR